MTPARPRPDRAGDTVTIFGVDIHPRYQAGINIEQIAREGFDWLAVKASQGTSATWAADADAWLDRGQAAGMLAFPYHYLTTDDVAAQVRTVQGAARGRPVMLDAEDGSGDVANVRRFLDAAARVGVRVPLVYLPRWWWEKAGGGSLAGLNLVASRYRTATGYASTIYQGVPDSWWEGYGGGSVTVLQFSDRASVAGQKIDVNAFRGTRAQLGELLGAPAAPAPGPAPAPPSSPYPALHEGDTSELVWKVQIFMNRVFPAYSDINAGSVPPSRLGPQTVAALTEFQRRSGIPTAPPFEVGPHTWAALEAAGFSG